VIPLPSLAELYALWRRVIFPVSQLTGEATSWDTPLTTPSPRLNEEGTRLGSSVDPDFALRLLKEEGNLDLKIGLLGLTFAPLREGKNASSMEKGTRFTYDKSERIRAWQQQPFWRVTSLWRCATWRQRFTVSSAT
jgi:hypothetical protein